MKMSAWKQSIVNQAGGKAAGKRKAELYVSRNKTETWENAQTLSVHRVLGGVAVAGDHLDFLFFAFLVFHLERSAVGGHDLHFQLAVGAVELVVGRR